MCGRYGYVPKKEDHVLFELSNPDEMRFDADYNIAPTTLNPIVIMNSPKQMKMAKWGFMPIWAKDPKIAFSTANARSEEIDTKAMWKGAFINKRCLIPVSYYYEFAHLEEDPKIKRAYVFKLKNLETFALAGLYSIWKDVEGKEILTYSIITTDANKLGSKVHSRMPVIIGKEDYDVWADNSHFDVVVLKSLMKPFQEAKMEAWPVSKEANNAKNNGPEIIKPIPEEPILPSKPAWEEKKENSN